MSRGSVHTVLGVRVHALSRAELLERVAELVRSGRGGIVAHHNLHSAALSRRDPRVRAFYRDADVAHVDGMSLVYAAKLLGLPLRREHRVTYVDLIGPLVALAARERWRVFCLAGRPGVAERAAARLREAHPGLEIETAHGWFEPEVAEQVVAKIRAFRPQLLFVGMGMPRQELFIRDAREQLAGCVALPCGGCFDYLAGVVPVPPRWLGRLGLEWLYRLGVEPTRLGRRYLLEPWTLLPDLLRELAVKSRR
jgi:N-acetylglucosaminyldiphosphoundecaprenol N-acetyl-beta-D-mannosaminyltransferase